MGIELSMWQISPSDLDQLLDSEDSVEELIDSRFPPYSDEDNDLIKDYFVNFLKKKPQGKILESNVTIGHDWCQDAGIYEFKMGTTGDKVKGRYSFIYVWEGGEWKISHHHSSVMPEAFLGPAPKPAVKEEAVDAEEESVLA